MLIKYPLPKTDIVIKEDYILNLVKNKKVLHLGAVGSTTNFKESLHNKIKESSEFSLGIDIDAESIEILKKNGFNEIICGNIEEINKIEQIKNIEWDYIVAADVIEHLSNPGISLEQIKNIMSNETKLIITLPNAFGFRILINNLLKKELVDPTHTFWPSYTTFKGLLERIGLKTSSFYFSLYKKPINYQKIICFIFKIFPSLSSGLIFVVEKD